MKILLAYTKPTRQLVDIKLQFNAQESTILQLPAWRPGRYEIANYAQYIYSLTITKGIGSIKKITKDCWQIDGDGNIEVSYQFYAARMDAGSSWLDENQLYLNFINCIPKIIGFENEPIEVNLDLPKEYKLACALKTKEHTLFANNYAELVDSPLFASASIKTLKYNVANTTFYIHIQGNWTPNEVQLIDDFKKFTQTQVSFFGGTFPAPSYHFLIQALPYKHYHGVEHQNSTVITLGPDSEINTSLYKELLGVSSHELFHAWNVTRIRPKEMVPYDFSTETYHTTGFITEGLTTYYGDWILHQCGIFSDEDYIRELNTILQRHFQNEGRNNSILDSSMDLWLDGYKLGSPNRKTSIYNEGALYAWLLDLKLADETNGKKTLQNILLDLWKDFGDTKTGYTFGNYKKIVNQYIDAEDYFENYIINAKPIEQELKKLLLKKGVELYWQDSDIELEHLYGIRTIPKGDNKEIIRIAQNSEAEEKLMIGDIIEKQETGKFSINRNGQLLTIKVIQKGNYFGYYQLNKSI